jgi:hypothetical protein
MTSYQKSKENSEENNNIKINEKYLKEFCKKKKNKLY